FLFGGHQLFRRAGAAPVYLRRIEVADLSELVPRQEWMIRRFPVRVEPQGEFPNAGPQRTGEDECRRELALSLRLGVNQIYIRFVLLDGTDGGPGFRQGVPFQVHIPPADNL